MQSIKIEVLPLIFDEIMSSLPASSDDSVDKEQVPQSGPASASDVAMLPSGSVHPAEIVRLAHTRPAEVPEPSHVTQFEPSASGIHDADYDYEKPTLEPSTIHSTRVGASAVLQEPFAEDKGEYSPRRDAHDDEYRFEEAAIELDRIRQSTANHASNGPVRLHPRPRHCNLHIQMSHESHRSWLNLGERVPQHASGSQCWVFEHHRSQHSR